MFIINKQDLTQDITLIADLINHKPNKYDNRPEDAKIFIEAVGTGYTEMNNPNFNIPAILWFDDIFTHSDEQTDAADGFLIKGRIMSEAHLLLDCLLNDTPEDSDTKKIYDTIKPFTDKFDCKTDFHLNFETFIDLKRPDIDELIKIIAGKDINSLPLKATIIPKDKTNTDPDTAALPVNISKGTAPVTADVCEGLAQIIINLKKWRL